MRRDQFNSGGCGDLDYGQLSMRNVAVGSRGGASERTLDIDRRCVDRRVRRSTASDGAFATVGHRHSDAFGFRDGRQDATPHRTHCLRRQLIDSLNESGARTNFTGLG